ncbi:MAG: hypothetical protein ACTSR8_19335 [Promethearchaeota archaeon]
MEDKEEIYFQLKEKIKKKNKIIETLKKRMEELEKEIGIEEKLKLEGGNK